MSEYITVLLWIGIFALVSKPLKVKRRVITNEGEIEKYMWFFSVLAFLPVIYIAATRPSSLGDTHIYKHAFMDMPSDFSSISDYLSSINKDYGFYFLSCLFKVFVSSDYFLYFGLPGERLAWRMN